MSDLKIINLAEMAGAHVLMCSLIHFKYKKDSKKP